MTRSPQSEDAYAGQYGGSPIVIPRRSTATSAGQAARQRRGSVEDPAPTDTFDMEGADYPGEPMRRRTSAVYQPGAASRQRQTTRLQAKPTKVIRRRLDRETLVIVLCLCIIVMVGGWWLLSTVASWWQGVQENWQYGSPRTCQADRYVGLGDSPQHPDHFLALNLHGVIEVIQLNPQDRSRDAVYVLARVNNDSTPASLSFRDTTGDGRTDVIVTIGESTPYSIVLLNTGKTLTPTQPAH